MALAFGVAVAIPVLVDGKPDWDAACGAALFVQLSLALGGVSSDIAYSVSRQEHG